METSLKLPPEFFLVVAMAVLNASLCTVLVQSDWCYFFILIMLISVQSLYANYGIMLLSRSLRCLYCIFILSNLKITLHLL